MRLVSVFLLIVLASTGCGESKDGKPPASTEKKPVPWFVQMWQRQVEISTRELLALQEFAKQHKGNKQVWGDSPRGLYLLYTSPAIAWLPSSHPFYSGSAVYNAGLLGMTSFYAPPKEMPPSTEFWLAAQNCDWMTRFSLLASLRARLLEVCIHRVMIGGGLRGTPAITADTARLWAEWLLTQADDVSNPAILSEMYSRLAADISIAAGVYCNALIILLQKHSLRTFGPFLNEGLSCGQKIALKVLLDMVLIRNGHIVLLPQMLGPSSWVLLLTTIPGKFIPSARNAPNAQFWLNLARTVSENLGKMSWHHGRWIVGKETEKEEQIPANLKELLKRALRRWKVLELKGHPRLGDWSSVSDFFNQNQK